MTEEKRVHAAHQHKHYVKKMETCKRVTVWVPREQVDAFGKAVERMKTKWKKDSKNARS